MFKIVSLSICLTACTFTAEVVPNDAALQDSSLDVADVMDAATNTVDAPSPNAWVYQQPNLSIKYQNCQRIYTDSGSTGFVEMTYPYDASTYKSAIPVYLCSNNINDGCNIEQLLVNNAGYYHIPTPNISNGSPNTLGSNCVLTTTAEINAVIASSPSAIYDWYVPSYSPTQLIADCASDGGSLYMTMVLLYDDNFYAMVDKNSASTMIFQCQ